MPSNPTTMVKYALVTGGSRGLGRAVCLRLAKMGIPVLINYQSNKTAAEEVRDEILASGGEASILGFNVADEKQVTAAIEAWEAEHPDDILRISSTMPAYAGTMSCS